MADMTPIPQGSFFFLSPGSEENGTLSQLEYHHASGPDHPEVKAIAMQAFNATEADFRWFCSSAAAFHGLPLYEPATTPATNGGSDVQQADIGSGGQGPEDVTTSVPEQPPAMDPNVPVAPSDAPLLPSDTPPEAENPGPNETGTPATSSPEDDPTQPQDISPKIIHDLCLLVEDEIPGGKSPKIASIAVWSKEERLEVAEWATAVHLSASDNPDITIPPVPMVLGEEENYTPGPAKTKMTDQ